MRRSDGGGRQHLGVIPVGMLAALVATGCSPAAPLNVLSASDGYDRTRSIAYGDGSRQTLDVYRPTGSRNAPLVVFFYGGSWQGGAKENYLFVAAALARRGFVVVVPDYRVYPGARFPLFVEDGARAVGWARNNANRFGGDPDKIILMGHSAGAHIAAMLALDEHWLGVVGLDPRRDVAGLIGLAGPYDFLPIKDETLKVIFGGADRAETQPITFVKGGEPPALLVTGPRDRTVDPGNATRLADRLRTVGSEARVLMPGSVGHLMVVGAFAWPLRFLAPVLREVADFVDAVTTNHRRRVDSRSPPS